jgi:hypothetical protein
MWGREREVGRRRFNVYAAALCARAAALCARTAHNEGIICALVLERQTVPLEFDQAVTLDTQALTTEGPENDLLSSVTPLRFVNFTRSSSFTPPPNLHFHHYCLVDARCDISSIKNQ